MLGRATSDDGLFHRVGRFSHDHAPLVIILSLLLAGGLASLLLGGSAFGESFDGDDLEANQAAAMIDTEFADKESGGPTFTIVFAHADWNASSPQFIEAVEAAVEATAADERVSNVSTPYNTPVEAASKMISDDGSHAIAIVTFAAVDSTTAKEDYPAVSELLDCAPLDCWRTGEIAIEWTFDEKLVNDLVEAEKLSAPLTLIILLVVFGSIVAALLPLSISLPTVVSAVGIIFWLSHQVDVSNYAVNIISLIGIGVSIDYSLFIVNRFREELAKGKEVREAIATTSATAGKAVFFSGITVVVGLAGMLFFSGTGLPSMGVGGMLAVLLAVFFSTTFLMAILSLLGERVNAGRIPLMSLNTEVRDEGLWKRIAEAVMDRPLTFLVPILVLLMLAGAPFLDVHLGLGGVDLLAPDNESRRGAEIREEEWDSFGGARLYLAANMSAHDRFANETIDEMHSFASTIAAHDAVSSVTSIHHPSADVSASDLKAIYNAPGAYWPDDISMLVESSSTENISLIVVSYNTGPGTPETNQLVRDLRALDEDMPYTVLVGGWGAISVDVIDVVEENLWKAIAFILVCTAVLIFLQVGSVIIPLKAIVMNILSLTASFGMLVFFFQQGHGLDSLLNFTPQPVDPTTPVIMFCIVFGLSMDYEVLMLSRIHEAWVETGDNRLAVSRGLQQTGRLITGAAAVMVVVFASFAIAEVQLIKAIGLGLALAILIDATLIRAVVVPATMRLMGRANWWAPKWLGGGGAHGSIALEVEPPAAPPPTSSGEE